MTRNQTKKNLPTEREEVSLRGVSLASASMLLACSISPSFVYIRSCLLGLFGVTMFYL